jgi:hypothetical protein
MNSESKSEFYLKVFGIEDKSYVVILNTDYLHKTDEKGYFFGSAVAGIPRFFLISLASVSA